MGLLKLIKYDIAQRMFDEWNPIKIAIENLQFAKYKEDYEFHKARWMKAFMYGTHITINRDTIGGRILVVYNLLIIAHFFIVGGEFNLITIFAQWFLIISAIYLWYKKYEYLKYQRLMDKL